MCGRSTIMLVVICPLIRASGLSGIFSISLGTTTVLTLTNPDGSLTAATALETCNRTIVMFSAGTSAEAMRVRTLVGLRKSIVVVVQCGIGTQLSFASPLLCSEAESIVTLRLTILAVGIPDEGGLGGAADKSATLAIGCLLSISDWIPEKEI